MKRDVEIQGEREAEREGEMEGERSTVYAEHKLQLNCCDCSSCETSGHHRQLFLLPCKKESSCY